ncbi:ArsA family ATPase [Natrarchaeobaculum sulfurireducens]|uniref:Arsenical pump-driving ATPase n=1 Tax=Natrarchaeobaculum sulfurireducens TaxID=2044521 RepID=A0A346PIZ9_9EURY|nr:TRC40/GET3/ArsA family transport-energizing ATPase [Natrarchaeobaculum sulfurireducens]AXR79494.1 Oxyanion-translocating ATPase [Natrarchaeobaculum sulfurireducens]AXR83261.1 Arsenical pump-driving ATPase [Natrarchaeobaculum sulfurireducens]
MTDCLFYGGKGGVGKTTCAAATALRLADSGRETLVVSTDPAHSLSDSLEVDLGPEPTELEAESGDEGGLWAVEIDAETQQERYERIATALAADLRSAGIRLDDEAVERVFASGAPAGSDELAALDLLVEYVDDGRWDVVVFDTAPTGHTLRLFDTPEVVSLALETTRSLRGQVRRIGTAARSAVFGPMAAMTGSSDGEDDLVALQARLERARDVLVDPETTEFRVVLLPERMAIAESERLVARLREADVSVGRLVVNQVLERPDPDCSRCHARHERHETRVQSVRETFDDLEVVTLPEREGEVQGLETVRALAERLPAEA